MKALTKLTPGLLLLLVPFMCVAGVAPRTALVETFTNTDCAGCVTANLVTQQYVGDHGSHEVINLQYHVSTPSPFDPFYMVNGAESMARAQYYGLSSAPSLRTAGNATVTGSYAALDSEVHTCRATASPLRVQVDMQRDGLDVDVSATITAVGDLASDDLTLHVALVEEYVHLSPAPGSNGETDFHWTVRRMLPDHGGTPLVIAEGQSLDFDFDTVIDAAWADTDIYAVVWVQDDAGREVLQAGGTIPAAALAFDFYSDRWGAAIPLAMVSGLYSWVENTGTETDTYDFHIAETMPGDWSLSACIDTVCHLPWIRDFTWTLEPGATAPLILDFVPGAGGTHADVTVTVTSQNDPGLNITRDFTAIAAGNDVLFVDADGGFAYETYFTDALSAAGATYSVWDRATLGYLTAADLALFPTVVWNADLITPALSASDRDALGDFIDQRGDLLLSGQDVAFDLASPSSPNWTPETQAWYETYTGASFAADDSHDSGLVGVAGDPIGNGLAFSIAGGTGANNQDYPDVLTPAANARAVLEYSPGVAAATRFLRNSAHIVTLGFGFEGVDTAANRNALMTAILAWLGDDTPSAADDLPGALRLAGRPMTQPNPFNPTTRISFELMGVGRSDVTVDVYDLQGRLVRTLWRGSLAAGPHAVPWDGRDGTDAPVASGTYLARIVIDGDSQTTKMVLAK